MTPDTPESRLARAEERISANARQIETLGPLVLQVERLQWTLDEFREDLKERNSEVERRLEKHEKATEENLERMARSFENQITACSSQVARLAEAQEKWQQDERQRREDQAREERQTTTQRLVARYGLVGVLIAALVGACASIVNTFFG